MNHVGKGAGESAVPRCASLIVTYNRLEKLQKCWAATAALPFGSIIIVNNASTDGTREWLTQLNDPRLCVINADSNPGGAGGFRRGAEYVTANVDADWVVFHDDDAYPPPDLLSCFGAVADPRWDAYCCKVVDNENGLCKMNMPYTRLPHTAGRDLRFMLGGVNFAPDGEHPRDVCSASFVGLIIDKGVLRANTRYIYPELFIYFDDLYFSWHLRLVGCRIRYSPELVFFHDVPPAKKGIYPEWKVYYLVRNLLLSRDFFSRQRPYSNGAIIIRVFKYLLTVATQTRKKEYIGFVFRGIIDGLTHKTGKRH
ncbi:glycosyltransferase [Sodalis sp. dw_96]|uniref:glycosyltransferase n=1 Tax=Sodalis sp. dw_96 TaxID=2719794 RepID=UPI001BD36D2F|nr:glycosyltransferase [Sodalis sp. dw_96]